MNFFFVNKIVKIRTTIQLAQALALGEQKEVDFSHIERTINVASQFESNLEWEKFKFDPITTDGQEKFQEERTLALEEETNGKQENKEQKKEKKKKKKQED